MSTGVPLIHLRAPISEQRDAWKAAARLGAARLTGHRLDIAAALNASRVLFSLPHEVKAAAVSSGGAAGFQRGYIPLGGESGLKSNLELKEGFCYGHEWTHALPQANGLTGHNVWPDCMGTACELCRASLIRVYSDAVRVIGHAASALVQSLQLHIDSTALLSGGETISIMRLFHYFSELEHPQVAPGTPRTGSSPHTDWHVLTLIVQDTTGGLQVLDPHGRWLDVPADGAEVVLLLGDYLHLLSQGTLHSPIHRVLLPTAGSHRYSLTFFQYPNFDATVPSEIMTVTPPAAHNTAQVATAGAFNTLVDSSDAKARSRLSHTPFGELLLEKWRGVTANRVQGAHG
uniref:Fe2OG dioxygenase domain-containing protein n=1 Tax=Coccolithus braarudii TaxID=221442 RepID=A0A7S0LEK9_9EUKA